MNKKVIAVDLDDVLSDSAANFIAFSNERWNLNLTIEDYNEHLAEMWQVEEAEAEKRILEFHHSGRSAHYSRSEAAVEVLQALSKKYQLIITTSRRRELEAITKAWLEKHYPGVFSDVRFAGIWDNDDPNRLNLTKAKLCREINASYLIDDQPKHCFAAAEVGIEALLFGEYPWNNIDKLLHGVTRVTSWKQIGEYFSV